MSDFKDLREWINRAKEIGELAVVEGAEIKSDNYEIGTITQITSRNSGPGVLFQGIKGYPPDFGVLTNYMSNIRTINLGLGLPLDNTIGDSVTALSQKIPQWTEAAKDFPPKMVDAGPILENVVEGDAIDLTKFPVPTWHELDSGPYIGTGVGVITRDPDTGQLNMGTYRGQLLDKRSVGSFISQGHHGRIHRDKYFERGEPCPMVMVFGMDPLLLTISATENPPDIFELNYAGAMRGESIPVIKGKVTGLPIPANAEIAIEGFVDPKARKLEGPFGEWTGYYAGGKEERPFLKAAMLYHRSAPIITGAPPAKFSYRPHNLLVCVWRSALLYNELKAAHVPDVRGVWLHPVGGSRHLGVISIKQRYDGHATQAGVLASQARADAMQGRYTIVVDEDIDPYDLDDVMWAVCTRSRPLDMDIIKKAWSSATDPTIRRPTDNYTTSRGIIYAVRPFEWRHEFAPVNVASEELRKQVFSKWKDVFKERWQVI